MLGFQSKAMRECVAECVEDFELGGKCEVVEEWSHEDVEEQVEKMEKDIKMLMEKENVPHWEPPG